MEKPVEIREEYYPVKWYCQRLKCGDSQKEPHETGKNGTKNGLK